MAKQLWSSGQIWDYQKFLTQYPQLAMPLAVLIFQDYGWKTWQQYFGQYNPQFTQWDYMNIIETYKRSVTYVIAPDKPLDLQYDFDDNSFRSRASVSAEFNSLVNNLIGMESRLPVITTVSPGMQNIDYVGLIAGWFVLDFVLPQSIKTNLILQIPLTDPMTGQVFSYSQQPYSFDNDRLISSIRASRGLLITMSAYRLLHFQASTQASYMAFNEVYGTSDIIKVPAKTISYVITNDPPPVQILDPATFFSSLFSTGEGLALLNAAASRYPVSVRSVFDWKSDPGTINAVTTAAAKGGGTTITYTIKYIFNDFVITIDEKQSMLVQYVRKKVEETYQIQHEKESYWALYIAAAAILAVVAIGVLAPALAGTTGAGGAVAETAVGASVSIPSAAVPGSGIVAGGMTAPELASAMLGSGMSVAESGALLAEVSGMTVANATAVVTSVAGSVLPTASAVLPAAKAALPTMAAAGGGVTSVTPYLAAAGAAAGLAKTLGLVGVTNTGQKVPVRATPNGFVPVNQLPSGQYLSSLQQVPLDSTQAGFFSTQNLPLLLIGGAVIGLIFKDKI